MMTPQEQYGMDVRGYIVVPNALDRDQLQMVQAAAARQQARAVALFESGGSTSPDLLSGQPLLSMADGRLQRASFFDTLECEPETISLIANPTIKPYVLSLVERPMLEQFSLTFMFRGGEIKAHAGHTPYQSINSYQVNSGRIYCNHLRVMYYLNDIIPGNGNGGLFVLPGSHKAEFPFMHLADKAASSLCTMSSETKSLFVEIGGRAGTAIIFTHDLVHCSFNEHTECRSVLHTAYNNAQFSRGWLDAHTNYAGLHKLSTPGSWQHYLTRNPDYLDHVGRPADSLWPSNGGLAKL